MEAAYHAKCIALKRRINEIEETNDSLRLRKTRINRAVLKMRLERAFLLEQLQKRMQHNMDESDRSTSPPPTVCKQPLHCPCWYDNHIKSIPLTSKSSPTASRQTPPQQAVSPPEDSDSRKRKRTLSTLSAPLTATIAPATPSHPRLASRPLTTRAPPRLGPLLQRSVKPPATSATQPQRPPASRPTPRTSTTGRTAAATGIL